MGSQGQTTVDFGTFPGSAMASVAITGQAGIIASSLVEAWLMPALTADHSADEHLVEPIVVRASQADIIAGTGFTIYATSDNRLGEPIQSIPGETSIFTASATTIGIKVAAPGQLLNYFGGFIPLVYGKWTVGWVWS